MEAYWPFIRKSLDVLWKYLEHLHLSSKRLKRLDYSNLDASQCIGPYPMPYPHIDSYYIKSDVYWLQYFPLLKFRV